MTRLLYIIPAFLLFLGLEQCRSYKPRDPLAVTRSQNALQEDFMVFRKIVETAHPSLELYLGQEGVRHLFDSLYTSIDRSLSLREFYNKLAYAVNEFGCSHSYVSIPDYIMDTLYNRPLFFPIPLYLVNKRLLVNSDDVLPHGTEILYINGRSPDRLLNSLAFYNTVDGKPREIQKSLVCADFGFQYFSRYGGQDRFSLSIKDTLGKERDTVIDAVTLDRLRAHENNAYYFDATDVPYSLHIDDEKKYALLRLTTFSFDSYNSRAAYRDFLKNTFELLRNRPDCQNLVIDLRENRGGYLYGCFMLYAYLASSPFTEYSSVFSRISKVPFKEFLSGDQTEEDIDEIDGSLKNEFVRRGAFKYFYADSLIEKWEPKKTRFRYQVYVITNPAVVSSASYFCTLVKNSGRGVIVGTETAGSDCTGNGFSKLDYALPNTKMKIEFPYANITYTFGSKKKGCGVIPDYFVADNDSTFMHNDDTQLLFILDSLISKRK